MWRGGSTQRQRASDENTELPGSPSLDPQARRR